jgi:acyl carrier protein
VSDAIRTQIRRVLRDHARLPVDPASLTDRADLFQAGMTSHASVNVMLALEDEFDVEFPESMLRKSTFESVYAIRTALGELVGSDSAYGQS